MLSKAHRLIEYLTNDVDIVKRSVKIASEHKHGARMWRIGQGPWRGSLEEAALAHPAMKYAEGRCNCRMERRNAALAAYDAVPGDGGTGK